MLAALDGTRAAAPSPSTSPCSRPPTTGCAPPSPTPATDPRTRLSPALGRPRRAPIPTRAAPPAPRRRAGPPRAGPLPRARRRPDRGRSRHGRRRRRRPSRPPGSTTDVALVVRRGPDRARLRLPRRAQARRRACGVPAARARGRRTPLPGRRRLDGRLHRRAAARRGRARWSRSTSATASWPGRCAATSGSSSTTARTSASSTAELIGGPVDLVVGDLSFISLQLVLDALIGVTRPDGDLALMVKPQFEVGKDRVGKGGVVRDPDLRAEAVTAVADAAASARLGRAGGADQPAARAVGQRRVLPLAATRSRRRGRRRDPRRGTSHRGPGGGAVRGWTVTSAQARSARRVGCS